MADETFALKLVENVLSGIRSVFWYLTVDTLTNSLKLFLARCIYLEAFL
jgi:hypothetical protein